MTTHWIRSLSDEHRETLEQYYQWTPGCPFCEEEQRTPERLYSGPDDGFEGCHHARHRVWTSADIAPWSEESRLQDQIDKLIRKQSELQVETMLIAPKVARKMLEDKGIDVEKWVSVLTGGAIRSGGNA